MMSCSRWAELADSLEFHAELAHYASAPTEFRLLNHDKPMRVGYGGDDEDEDGKTALDEFLTIIQKRPYGQTPLCKHIAEVVQEVGLIADDLRQAGQMACLVIASDGEATDGKLVKAMLPLKSLPVWVVIRLCTNDPQVLKYWNEIDSELELNMDVIDDFYGEAVEVKRVNPWLTYGEPLQRIREFGVYIKDLDLLDENPCSLAQIRHICSLMYVLETVVPWYAPVHPNCDCPRLVPFLGIRLLPAVLYCCCLQLHVCSHGHPYLPVHRFGVTEAEIERPEADWKGFCRRIQGLNASTPPVVSPVSVAGQPREWIKLHRLDRRGIKKKPTCAIS